MGNDFVFSLLGAEIAALQRSGAVSAVQCRLSAAACSLHGSRDAHVPNDESRRACVLVLLLSVCGVGVEMKHEPSMKDVVVVYLFCSSPKQQQQINSILLSSASNEWMNPSILMKRRGIVQ